MIQRMKRAAAAFFDQPLEVKKKYAMAENDVQGYGQAFVVSEDQKLDWADLMFLLAYPPQHRNLKNWPLIIPGFKYVFASCYNIMIKLLIWFLRKNCLNLNPK